MDNLNTIYIWNIKYNLLNEAEIARIVGEWLAAGRRGIHLTGADSNTVMLAQNNDFQRQAILDSDIVNVDSFVPAYILKKQGYDLKQRVPTPDVAEALFKLSDEQNRSVYFLGAKDSTLDQLIPKMREEYPSMRIVGWRNGYFDLDKEGDSVASAIDNLHPDFLFIGMPSPMKESFILRYKHKIDVGCFYGIGGAFDAKAGVMPRPPKWLRNYGMEGFFRVLRNPVVYGDRIIRVLELYRLSKALEKSRK